MTIVQTYAYTTTRTRTDVVEDQFDMFLRYTLVPAESRKKLLALVNKKQIQKVGVYLVNATGKRFLEIVLSVDWKAHANYVAVSPTVRTDLPGWEEGASPEVNVLGHRFGRRAQELGQVPAHWVIYADEIIRSAETHRRVSTEAGYQYGGTVPEWSGATNRQDGHRLQGLDEVGLCVTEALN